ncbi:MAG TPA: DHA2 family efflux MFS transporter permease subunit [Longimicrobiaceae bacterium]|nr:DHA2 family efflux MFS transporter permease subunit [Longimicrobiaceae bacterium]
MTESYDRKWVIAATVMIGNVMAVLDSSIVNVALPSMGGNLGATIEEITWVVTGYILANVLVMPIVGMLSARFGRKHLYMTSIAVFTGASMLCGLATSLEEMVAFRMLQGLAGGILVTVPQAILRESFPPSEQGMAMGVYGMGVVLAPAIGPTLGGWLTDQYSWPWVFFINVPMGILNLIMVQRIIEDPPYLERRSGKMDLAGLGFMIVGLGAFQLMLEEGERNNWFDSSFITRLAILAGVGMALFIWRELTAERPAVDIGLLKNVHFSAATFIGGIMGAGLSGTLFVLPLFLQNLLGYDAMESGLAMMPRSLAMLVMMPLAGRLYNRMGPRLMVSVGVGFLAYGYWELTSLTTQTDVWDLAMPQVYMGIGASFLFAALSTAALAAIPRARMTAATGLYNVVRQVMGSIGIAVVATLLTHSQATYHAILATDASGPTARQFVAGLAAKMHALGMDAATAHLRALALLDLRITRQAMVLAYNHLFALGATVFVLVFPLVFLLQRSAHLEDVEVMME